MPNYHLSLFLLSCFKRANIATIDEKNVSSRYQNLQYFITESNSWDAKEVNDERIEILQKNRTTKSTENGVLVIDDTACSKKWAFKTDGVRPQHSGSEDAVIRCNVLVCHWHCLWLCSSYADSEDVRTSANYQIKTPLRSGSLYSKTASDHSRNISRNGTPPPYSPTIRLRPAS